MILARQIPENMPDTFPLGHDLISSLLHFMARAVGI